MVGTGGNNGWKEWVVGSLVGMGGGDGWWEWVGTVSLPSLYV